MHQLKFGYVFLALACLIHPVAYAANIAMFTLIGTSGHKSIMYGIAEGLIPRGHKVDYYSVIPATQKVKGLNEIRLEHADEWTRSGIEKVSIFGPNGNVENSEFLRTYYDIMTEVCGLAYETEEFKKLANSKKKVYDVALVDIAMQDCVLPLAQHIAETVIYVSTTDFFADWRWRLNIPAPYAYMPHFSLTNVRSFEMNFWERLHNTFASTFSRFIVMHIIQGRQEVMAQKYASHLLSIDEARKHVAMVFVSSHPSLHQVTPTSPMVKYISGINMREHETLPKDIQDFADNSGDAGFIFVSFGSFVRADTMPVKARDFLAAAFAKIPQKVLWKYENPIPGLSKNVKLVGYVPQTALFAHPKIKAFFTHGGLNSVTEAVHFGVPMIILPIFADQALNARRLIDNGLAYEMSWTTINTEKTMVALNTLLNDTSYKINANRHKNIFRDRLVPPKEEAAYWVEYAVRHKGSTHLRIDADHLNFMQYLLIDVFAFVGAALFIILYVVYFVVSRLCCSRSKKEGKKNKNE